jgi:hypothetical protein
MKLLKIVKNVVRIKKRNLKDYKMPSQIDMKNALTKGGNLNNSIKAAT